MLIPKTTALGAILLAATGLAPKNPSPVQAPPVLTQTLFAHDPLRRSLSLVTGEHGTTISDHQLFNVDSEIEFGAYLANGLTAGIQGGQVGEFLDLGTASDLATAYGYQETVGGGQGFASIHFRNGLLVILQDYFNRTFQPFAAGNAFLNAPPPTFSTGVVPTAGHIYLVKITDRHDPDFLRFAKLIVVSRPGDDSVELAWQMLRSRGE